jgi:hypothetical protein
MSAENKGMLTASAGVRPFAVTMSTMRAVAMPTVRSTSPK